METSRAKQHLQPKTYHFYAWFFPGLFTTRRDEKLFLEYTKSQKQIAIPRLIATGLLLQIFCAFVPGEVNFVFAYALTLTAFIANLTLLALHYGVRSKRTIISHVTWFIIWAQLLISALRRHGDAYNELLGWAALLQYLTLAALPFSAPILIIYSILSFSSYLIIQYCNAAIMENNLPEDFIYQEICSGSILLCASLLGATGYVIYENRHRRSFVETKRSLRDKLTIEQQSKEQERLLLSVLPEHVAIQMRKDLGLIDTQFKKIYMSRHENVSILYADIVGFTAISSTYSAQDLVAILNELFARFDRLAEKYQQLRIKILGDCYYCISGAPVERPDHAVLCVHMGLSMVKAIKYVQQTTNSPVDMRVGIHTGAVLAGVLGQRQWQFDVYSRDVELANKMESSGMAGRVHVSEVTLGFLKDEFEVEPAYGEKREEMLRQAGIKTYFIVKVLKPYHGEEKSGEGAEEEGGDTLSDLRDDDEESVLSNEGEKQGSEDMLIHDMLEEELKNRDDNKELEATGCCLGFYSKAERVYMERGESNPMLLLLPPIYMTLPYIVVTLLAVPLQTLREAASVIYLSTSAINTFIFFVIQKWTIAKGKVQNQHARMMYTGIHFTIFMGSCIVQVVHCSQMEEKLQNTMLRLRHYNATQDNTSSELLNAHPSYYFHMTICLFCCGVLISPARWIFRLGFFMLMAFNYLFVIYIDAPTDLQPIYDQNPYILLQNGSLLFTNNISNLQTIHYFRHIIMIYLVIWCICIFDRYMEEQEWARHLRGMRMRLQAEQAGDLRRRNQALVYNVLPPHVARHFMGAHRNHRDLYSQSYAEVGVLFASMPNFTEFYSEETVNNQGLECLRFLNEVISDFDTLLGNLRFCKDIIKIKTISSTYMAASGLNPDRDLKNAETTTLRWKHLMCLVEFALELQKVLAAINEQSFNHFVLRMGVNHGPITAGVIGAKKPHYDIWGNTVNVASRMESTGKAGCIQVTEETCNILKEFGYYFEQRGLVSVKGKGQLMTYYLQGRNSDESQEGSQEPAPKADVDCIDRAHLVKNGSAKPCETQEEIVVNIPLLEIKK